MKLNARQVEILRWIADGTPDRDWPDWSHRTTAKALQSRGLVVVRGHGSRWQAEITERGARVLNGDELAQWPSATPKPGKKAPGPPQEPAKRPRVDVDPEDLLSDLLAQADRTLRFPDPEVATRAGYRSALGRIPADLLPVGVRVTYTGRNRGDLVIRLVESPQSGPPAPTVVVPERVDDADPLVGWLRAHPQQLKVSVGSLDRALRIIQALESTLAARGHQVSKPPQVAPAARAKTESSRYDDRRARVPDPPEPATLQVTVEGETLLLDLVEELDRRLAVPEEEAAKIKYEWQRARPVEMEVPSGRLALRIRDGYRRHAWADRKRWSLDSRLPTIVLTLEEVAQEHAKARLRVWEEKRQRRHEWDEALPKARRAHIEAVNRERLARQLDAYALVEQRRRYADAVDQRATSLGLDDGAAVRQWADWIRKEADRIDPTLKTEDMAFVEPTDICPWHLDKYMPRGFSAASSPDEDD